MFVFDFLNAAADIFCGITNQIVKPVCDGVVLEIYSDHKFQWPQEGLNCECLGYEVVT